jgi:hypothetical protein
MSEDDFLRAIAEDPGSAAATWLVLADRLTFLMPRRLPPTFSSIEGETTGDHDHRTDNPRHQGHPPAGRGTPGRPDRPPVA